MHVTKQIDNLKTCTNCKCIDESAYIVTISNQTILLCDQCKHELTAELIMN